MTPSGSGVLLNRQFDFIHRFLILDGFTKSKFQWQEGFGAFYYSLASLQDVIGYIQLQKEHHSKLSFKEEYLSILNSFQIEFKDQYLFQWIE